jgi:hypothetical protein
MSDYQLSDILDKQNTKILYVYDFINMWTFLVVCCRRSSCWKYILKLFSHGEMPDEAMKKTLNLTMLMTTTPNLKTD